MTKLIIIKKLILAMTSLLALLTSQQKFGGDITLTATQTTINTAQSIEDSDLINTGKYQHIPWTKADSTNDYQVNVWQKADGTQGYITDIRTLKTSVSATGTIQNYYEITTQ